MGIRLSEHKSFFIRIGENEADFSTSKNELVVSSSDYLKYKGVISKPFNKNSYRFQFCKNDSDYEIKADYCVGIDWIGKTGRFVYVEPKLNTRNIDLFVKELEKEDEQETDTKRILNEQYHELDYLKMLLDVTSTPESYLKVKDLVQIDWNSKHISIEQKDDKLTPFLIVQFLQSLRQIVRKGLKKSYYKVSENLNNRVRGKILVGQHIKQNLYKNKLTSTYCEYQVFGVDNLENRFLKKVLNFVISYVENNKVLLDQNYAIIQDTINFCRPSFEHISSAIKENELKHMKHNPFYKDYKDSVEIGSHILRRFAYNITSTTDRKVTIPPFWIDMPSLFELFVYSKMIEANSEHKHAINYQFSTLGNALDILVSHPDYPLIIDTKYKLKYNQGHLHNDIRQVAGYARLNKVRKKIGLQPDDDSNIDCLIIYPDPINGITDLTLQNINDAKSLIKVYHKVWKLGVKLPVIN